MQNQKTIKLTGLAAILTGGLFYNIHAASPPPGFDDLNWGLSNAAVTIEGYLDITKAPYNMNNTGGAAASNTTSLQNAIDDAYTHNLAIFFPAGTYQVDGQLNCFQVQAAMTNAHVFVGSAAGAHPVIKLKNGTFPSTSNKTPLFNYYCSLAGDGTGPETPAAGYNFVIRGIDIDMGSNPGGIAIDLHAAQGCTIQDVSISGSNYFAGIQDLCGSGGHHANITITGGQHAFYVKTSRPMPTLTGITCINQTTRTFELDDPLTTITIVGFKFQQDTDVEIFDLNIQGSNASNERKEHLNLIDGSIEYTGPQATRAILNQNRSIYMRNVYVKNAATIVENSQGANLLGHANWSHVGDYNFYHVVSRQLINTTYSSNDYGASSLTTNCAAPPNDLISRHVWDESTFPHFELSASEMIKITKTGPGGDDTNTINDAIVDAEAAGHNTVFLGKGDYNITNSIILKKDTRLIGVSRNLTRIHWDVDNDDNVTAPNWGYLFTTPPDANATCLLAWMAFEMPKSQTHRIAFTDWTAGRHSMVREVHFRKATDSSGNGIIDMKRFQISETGGGRWYGLFFRNGQTGGEDSNHRMLLIENTSEPLSLYAYTIEYQESLEYMTEISNSDNISIYGFKGETDLKNTDDDDTEYRHTTPLGITNGSTNIMVMGQSGLGEFENGESDEGLIEIEGNSTNIMVANADGGWRDHEGYYLVLNKDDNKGLKKFESGAESNAPAALYIKGSSPTPIVYTPPTSGGGGGGGGGSSNGEIQNVTTGNVFASSGDTQEWKSSGVANGGEFLLYKSNADGDYIQFNSINVPAPGNYDIYVNVQKGSNAGILQLQVNDARENIGSPIDCYSSTYGFERILFGSKHFTSAGTNKKFTFEVTGKNSSSSNRYIRIDYIELVSTSSQSNLYDNDCTSGNPDDDFDPINSTMANWSYNNGKLDCSPSWRRIELTAENATSWTDYTIDVDVENDTASGGNKEVSTVLVRCGGGENYYGILIDRTNKLFVGKKSGGAWNWGTGVATTADYGSYSLSIDVSGSSTTNIDIYIGGASTATMNYTDSTSPFTVGGPGFEARAKAAKFDNIVVQ